MRRWCISFSYAIVVAASLIPTYGGAESRFELNDRVPPLKWVLDFTANGAPLEQLNVGDQLTLKLMGGPEGEFSFKPVDEKRSFLSGGVLLGSIQGDAVELTVLKTGPIEVHPMKILDPSGKEIARTDRFSFITKGKPPQVETPPLYPPLSLPWPVWIRYSVWALIALAVLLILGFALFGLKRWAEGNKKFTLAPRTRVSEDQAAIRRLKDLENEAHWKKKLHKKHVFGISETLKVYFSDRFAVDALESTTEEMLRLLESANLSNQHLDEVDGLFRRLDRVKFTDYDPSEKESQSAVEDALKIVQITRRIQNRTPSVLGESSVQEEKVGG